MKKVFLVCLIIAAMVIPSALFAAENAGNINIGGKVKWAYIYKAEDEDSVGAGTAGQAWGMDGAAIEQFITTNVEIDINGTVGEKVAYVIELQAAADNGGWGSNPDEMGAIGVRQAKIMISDMIPMTTVTLGTFNPPLGVYQPRGTNDWDLINLPLINMAQLGANFYTPIGLGWQATGVDFCISPADMIKLDLVYFNGYAGGMPNLDNASATDLEKSWLINLAILPTEGANISIAYLMEGWQEPATDPGLTHTANAAGWVVSGAYVSERLEANFDWMQMTADNYQIDLVDGDEEDLTWTGYQITLGYWATDSFEILARYEFVDPNTVNDDDFGVVTKYDALTWITLGMNYRLNENAEVALNYIWMAEQGDQIDMGATPIAEVGGKYQKLNNDTLLIQVQVWQ